ncbi:hypothetical protein Zmor_027786 [Zophobas morio]|uniref:Uncharacterized protein n=1 Tax=Zophobas morio TaxID=2755281 RepID=A0AA38M3C3_9CUCU|nr:hypothetical protein Zmor_027786 [Zophobas morio]
MVPTKDDDDLIFAFNLSKARLGENFLKNLSRCVVFPISYVSSAISCSNLLTLLLIIDPQVQLCLHGIKNLTTRAALINQKEIAKTLKLLINYHSSTSGFARYIAKRIQFLVLPLEILGTAVLMSIVVFYFWFEGSLKDQYLRVGAMTITSFTALVGTAVVGQEIEDYTDEIFDALVQVEWCDWNESNKKMYLMLLISLSKPIKIKFSENISVNYELGVQVNE